MIKMIYQPLKLWLNKTDNFTLENAFRLHQIYQTVDQPKKNLAIDFVSS